MSRVAIATDSNSGITQKEAKELGIFVLPMPFYIDDELYFEDITLTQEQFYEKLEQDCDVKTSQPSPGNTLEFWDEILKEYDSIVYIPMSSGLSSSMQTATMLAEDYDGRVQVVDNQRISITQRQAALDAKVLAEAGLDAVQIKDILLRDALDASIYIMVDTMKYLKKGGRVTPAAALLGTVLHIKPVLQIQGEKLDSYAKVRGVKLAKKTMIHAIANDLETRFEKEYEAGLMELQYAYTHQEESVIQAWEEELKAAFPKMQIRGDALSLSVSCHIGPGALAVGIMKKSVL